MSPGSVPQAARRARAGLLPLALTLTLTLPRPGLAQDDPYRIGEPVAHAASGVSSGPALEVVEAASGLTVTLVSDRVGFRSDMIALWPDSAHPTHAIVCNEVGPTDTPQASVQRVDLASGDVTDMVSGLQSCDPAKRTPWGTVIVGEERGDGRVYEIIDPLDVTGVTVQRDTATSNDPRVVARLALGQLAYEGIAILPDGTVYYGDERRPARGSPGGGIYRFVPVRPWTGGEGITDLAQSPLADGSVWVARLGTLEDGTDWGQGSDLGAGRWVALGRPADRLMFDLHAAGEAVGMTGWYRPEDMALDPVAAAHGTIRLCWNNTGRDVAANWGETLCLVDTPEVHAGLAPGGRMPIVSRFVQGSPELRMPDNIDFDPLTGNLWIAMDATTGGQAGLTNDDVWVCLPDADDVDVMSDGCERAMTLRDGEAEFTGIEFLADGSGFYLNLMHRAQEGDSTPGTSDMLLVTFAQRP